MIRVVNFVSEEFHEAWAKALPQLERLRAKFPDDCDWTPDFVISQIEAGCAGFVDCEDGFFILREYGPHMEIWIGAAYEGESDELPDYLSALNFLVRESGYEGLVFSTIRKGWEQRAPEVGFRVLSRSVTYIYEGVNEEAQGTGHTGIGSGEVASS